MTQAAPDAKVISRIHKLMALAKDVGATEAEATLAAQKAQEIMAEHNLTMASVEAAGGSSGEEGKRTTDRFERPTVYNWQKSLMAEVARLNFCYCDLIYRQLRHTNQFVGYRLIGRAANVAACQNMFDYLVGAIDRLAREHVGDPKKFFTKYAHSYREGCADRVSERLNDKLLNIIKQQKQKAREEEARRKHPSYSGTTLPVVLMTDHMTNEDDLNNDHKNGWAPGTTVAKRLKEDNDAREREASRTRLYDEAKAAGHSNDIAYYISHGWSLERAIELATPEPVKEETDAQRRRREEKEARQQERWDEQQRNKRYREHARLDRAGYSAGSDAGDRIGLDDQISNEQRKRVS